MQMFTGTGVVHTRLCSIWLGLMARDDTNTGSFEH